MKLQFYLPHLSVHVFQQSSSEQAKYPYLSHEMLHHFNSVHHLKQILVVPCSSAVLWYSQKVTDHFKSLLAATAIKELQVLEGGGGANGWSQPLLTKLQL